MTNQQIADKATHVIYLPTQPMYDRDYRQGRLSSGKEYEIVKRENGEVCLIDDTGKEFWHVICIIPETGSWGMLKPIIMENKSDILCEVITLGEAYALIPVMKAKIAKAKADLLIINQMWQAESVNEMLVKSFPTLDFGVRGCKPSQLREQLSVIINTSDLNSSETPFKLCEAFLNCVIANKNELAKNNRVGYLIDVILNDEIFD
jgi:hypothetical protein